MPIIIGIIQANQVTEMNVFERVETESDGSQTIRVHHTEAYTRGIALQAHEILSIESDLLGGTVSEHLERQDLIVK